MGSAGGCPDGGVYLCSDWSNHDVSVMGEMKRSQEDRWQLLPAGNHRVNKPLGGGGTFLKTMAFLPVCNHSNRGALSHPEQTPNVPPASQ
uniref:Uncharacterized protein n=1 Tax=Pyxicephalus adspersus TaxID=30357 RepID=A0AAV2ZH61_PYXAD|nr:TPA: hypothetical protein GDO54_002226 [Pyxicephalus adspersus]